MTAPAATTEWRSRIVGSGEADPRELKANPKNWRLHPPGQQEALAGALDQVGWVQQVVVNRQTGLLVDGHLRVELAAARGAETIPVLFVDLEPAEEDLVLASLDPIGAMAERDDDALRALLADIRFDSRALEDAVRAPLPGQPAVGLTDPDDAPLAPEAPTVVAGELYALGDHRLLVGDATAKDDVDRVLDGDEVDLLWTDPPYGVAYEGKTDDALRIQNDDLRPDALREFIAAALRLVPLRRGGGVLHRHAGRPAPRRVPARGPGGGPAGPADDRVGQGPVCAGALRLPLPPRAHPHG